MNSRGNIVAKDSGNLTVKQLRRSQGLWQRQRILWPWILWLVGETTGADTAVETMVAEYGRPGGGEYGRGDLSSRSLRPGRLCGRRRRRCCGRLQHRRNDIFFLRIPVWIRCGFLWRSVLGFVPRHLFGFVSRQVFRLFWPVICELFRSEPLRSVRWRRRRRIEYSSGGNSSSPSVNPLIVGLFESLPPDGTVWTSEGAVDWLQAAAANLRIVI